MGARVEVEQHGQRRAGYGDEVIERLATRLARSARRGFGVRTLRRIRLFSAALSKSKTAKIRTAVLSKLLATAARFPMNVGWAHYRMYLPKHEEQRAELAKEREEAERALRRTGEDDTS